MSGHLAELELRRHWYSRRSTIGTLTVDGADAGFTLEPPKDHPEHPCIPVGRYLLSRYESPKFGRTVLLLHDVPGREWIEIHVLNYPDQTQGCIGVGLSRGLDYIAHSAQGLDALLTKLDGAESIYITVIDDVWVTFT
jgi:hypothetical protein